ncbi:HAD-IA family hydrolase [Streptomyces sp. NPDC054854]
MKVAAGLFEQTFGRRPEDPVRDAAPHLDPVAERHALNELMRAEGNAFPPVKGADDLLATLRPESWAIVTSGSREPVHQRFGRASLPLPRVQVYGEDVLNAKPHPDAYLLAAARLGAEPSRCFVVKDAPAGVAVGCTVIGITTTHDAGRLLHADACVSSLTELRPRLSPFLGGRAEHTRHQ